MNSSKTWKSGEKCRVTGAYRCEVCHLAGRETAKDFSAGSVLPMCDACPEKDATWRLLKTSATGS
jgi:hypothetical protein